MIGSRGRLKRCSTVERADRLKPAVAAAQAPAHAHMGFLPDLGLAEQHAPPAPEAEQQAPPAPEADAADGQEPAFSFSRLLMPDLLKGLNRRRRARGSNGPFVPPPPHRRPVPPPSRAMEMVMMRARAGWRLRILPSTRAPAPCAPRAAACALRPLKPGRAGMRACRACCT